MVCHLVNSFYDPFGLFKEARAVLGRCRVSSRTRQSKQPVLGSRGEATVQQFPRPFSLLLEAVPEEARVSSHRCFVDTTVNGPTA